MNIFSWLDDGVCERLMLTFAHFLWQGVAIGLLAGLLGFLMRHRSAGARYLLFTSALLAMVACPPVTYCFVNAFVSGTRGPSVLRLNTLDSEPFSRESETSANLSKMHLNPPSTALPDLVMDHMSGFPDVPSQAEPGSNGALFAETPLLSDPAQINTTQDAAIDQSESANWPTVVRFLTYCYLLGVVLLLGRFVLGMQEAGRIRRSSRLLDDPDILRAITRRAKALGLRRPPPVLLCHQLLIPAVVGIMRPAILFPVA
ncbi:MAG: hypothetical protein IID46_03960, partial [Planctomycetes bacterium]|nr:hypothetical protein [Planctomycetota bacterium]